MKAILTALPSPEVNKTSVLGKQPALPPRLLGVRDAARYLGLSPFTIRNMLKDKRLLAVSVPDVARVLVDRCDLDALIECWKVSVTTSANVTASASVTA